MPGLRERYEQTKEAAQRIDPRFKIYLGQEILYFEGMTDWLDQGKALTLADSRYVLVEFRPGDNFIKLSRAVRELVSAGYLPIVAHIERYDCLREKGRTAELIGLGAYLQMNAGSDLGGSLIRTQGGAGKRSRTAGSTLSEQICTIPGAVAKVLDAWKKLGKKNEMLRKQIFWINQKYILKDKTLKR